MTSDCAQCGHPHDPHLMVPTQDDPMMGGVMFCQERDCTCFATWDVPPFSTRTDVRIPDAEELAEIKRAVFDA